VQIEQHHTRFPYEREYHLKRPTEHRKRSSFDEIETATSVNVYRCQRSTHHTKEQDVIAKVLSSIDCNYDDWSITASCPSRNARLTEPKANTKTNTSQHSYPRPCPPKPKADYEQRKHEKAGYFTGGSIK
jgi:hypothetical protein